jgi:hypothetical protein
VSREVTGKGGMMETIIGFVAGYLVGTREGRAGLERLRRSWQGIARSPQVRKLASEAVSAAEAAARGAMAGGTRRAAAEVTDMVLRRAGLGTRGQDRSRAA